VSRARAYLRLSRSRTRRLSAGRVNSGCGCDKVYQLLNKAVVIGYCELIESGVEGLCAIAGVELSPERPENIFRRGRARELGEMVCDCGESAFAVVYLVVERVVEVENYGLYHRLMRFSIDYSAFCTFNISVSRSCSIRFCKIAG